MKCLMIIKSLYKCLISPPNLIYAKNSMETKSWNFHAKHSRFCDFTHFFPCFSIVLCVQKLLSCSTVVESHSKSLIFSSKKLIKSYQRSTSSYSYIKKNEKNIIIHQLISLRIFFAML